MTLKVAPWTNFMHASEYIQAKCNALQLNEATQKGVFSEFIQLTVKFLLVFYLYSFRGEVLHLSS